MPHQKQLGSHLSKEFRRALRKQRESDGFCSQCGEVVEKDLKNRVTGKLRRMCRACLRKHADKTSQVRKSRSTQNLCERCGQRPPKDGVKSCAECTRYLSENQRKYRHARFFDNRARTLGTYSVGFAKELCFLWKRQRGKCALTGRRLSRDNSEIDHIVPLSRGGSDEISNLRWLHKDVNQAKRSLSDDEFITMCSEVAWAARGQK